MGVTSINDGKYFDYEGNGFAQKTSWAGDGNGVLVFEFEDKIILFKESDFNSFDFNNDGVIDK